MDPNAPARQAVHPDVVDVCVLYRHTALARGRAGDAGPGARWRVLMLQRGPATRCPSSWELVHGRIERGERPEQAALRELREETGFAAERLYAITVNAFYLAGQDIRTAVVFAAVVGEGAEPPPAVLGPEHVDSRWLSLQAAKSRATWPREREAMDHIAHLLRTGNAGVAEDVLRIV